MPQIEGLRSPDAVKAAVGSAVYRLTETIGASMWLPTKGLQGWERSLTGYDAEGHKRAAVYFGGRDDAHVVATSSVAHEVRMAVAGLRDARTSRVDTRVDTLTPFEEVKALLEEAAYTYGSKVTTMQSSVRGESMGRTVYLGAPTSRVRVRLYEKWLESPGEYAEGTNRVEVQLRPDSGAKARVSGWTPGQTFCASKTTATLAALLEQEVEHADLRVSNGPPDLERTIAHMSKQYSRAVERWMRYSGGDAGKFLDLFGQ